MIVLPRLDEVRGTEWVPDDGPGKSFLTGAAAPLALGTFRLPDDPHLLAAPPGDDPVTRADTLRERAGQVFERQRAMGAFNRELDDLFTNIAEGTDWSEGLSKFDKEIGNLRQKHGASLRSPDDRAAFEQHADSFAAMQRIGLKRALVGRQQADALAQLDEQLAYYAGKAAAAPNEVFRRIAIDAGQRAIAELRDAGYLFPEGAEKRQQAFLGLIDGADLEAIASANPDEAVAILDNPALFPNADAATRQRLRGPPEPRPLPATGNPPPIRTMEWREDRDGPRPDAAPINAPAGEDSAAEYDESTGRTSIDEIAKSLAPLAEKNDGLRELLGELHERPDDPSASVRLAAGLLDASTANPEAAGGGKSPVALILQLLEKGSDLITRGRGTPSKPSGSKESATEAAPIPSRREPTAADPVGRRGERPERDVREGTNPPTTINGREYSGHALDEMQNSGFTPTVVEHAIQTGLASTGDKGESLHYDAKNNLTVATDKETGRVITAWPGRPGKRNR